MSEIKIETEISFRFNVSIANGPEADKREIKTVEGKLTLADAGRILRTENKLNVRFNDYKQRHENDECVPLVDICHLHEVFSATD